MLLGTELARFMSRENVMTKTEKSKTSTLAERYLDQLLNDAWGYPKRGEETQFATTLKSNSNPHAKTNTPHTFQNRGSSRTTVHPFFIFLFSPIPILNSYIQQKKLLGHFQAIQLVLFGIFASLSVLFWQDKNTPENEWLFVSSFAILFACTTLISYFCSWAGGLKMCGVIDSNVNSEKKFIVLGILFILLSLSYGAMANRQPIQTRVQQVQEVLQKRGFEKSVQLFSSFSSVINRVFAS